MRIDDYRHILTKRVNECHAITGLPLEDLHSEASYLFYKAVDKFDEKKGDFKGYLYGTVRFGLMYYAEREARYMLRQSDGHGYVSHNRNPRAALIWKEKLESFSEEARFLIDVVLNHSYRIHRRKLMSLNTFRGKMRRYCKRKGISERRYYQIVKEIREGL